MKAEEHSNTEFNIQTRGEIFAFQPGYSLTQFLIILLQLFIYQPTPSSLLQPLARDKTKPLPNCSISVPHAYHGYPVDQSQNLIQFARPDSIKADWV